MDDHTFNIAEAKMHLSKLVERVERGEHITIARNNRPVAIVSPIAVSPEHVLARLDAVRERITQRLGQQNLVVRPGETWRDLVDEGRRL